MSEPLDSLSLQATLRALAEVLNEEAHRQEKEKIRYQQKIQKARELANRMREERERKEAEVEALKTEVVRLYAELEQKNAELAEMRKLVRDTSSHLASD